MPTWPSPAPSCLFSVPSSHAHPTHTPPSPTPCPLSLYSHCTTCPSPSPVSTPTCLLLLSLSLPTRTHTPRTHTWPCTLSVVVDRLSCSTQPHPSVGGFLHGLTTPPWCERTLHLPLLAFLMPACPLHFAFPFFFTHAHSISISYFCYVFCMPLHTHTIHPHPVLVGFGLGHVSGWDLLTTARIPPLWLHSDNVLPFYLLCPLLSGFCLLSFPFCLAFLSCLPLPTLCLSLVRQSSTFSHMCLITLTKHALAASFARHACLARTRHTLQALMVAYTFVSVFAFLVLHMLCHTLVLLCTFLL